MKEAEEKKRVEEKEARRVWLEKRRELKKESLELCDLRGRSPPRTGGSMDPSAAPGKRKQKKRRTRRARARRSQLDGSGSVFSCTS